jgi:hypothetical protein
VAADDASRDYLKRTPEQERTADGIWNAMTKASEKLVKCIVAKDFEKYLSVANPKNGDEFIAEVLCISYYLSFLIPFKNV